VIVLIDSKICLGIYCSIALAYQQPVQDPFERDFNEFFFKGSFLFGRPFQNPVKK